MEIIMEILIKIKATEAKISWLLVSTSMGQTPTLPIMHLNSISPPMSLKLNTTSL